MRTYRFPMPQQERILLAATLILGAMVIGFTALQVGQVAHNNALDFGALFGASGTLRGVVAMLVVLYVVAMWASWAYASVKAGTRLELGDDTLVYQRPATPVIAMGAQQVEVSAEQVDRLTVLRMRRASGMRTELHIHSGRTTLAINLDHVVGPDCVPAKGLVPREQWLTHPLVVAVAELTGRDVTRG